MWRFISVTFAFLGYSFYALSGGSDYAPRTQSFQARAKIDHVRPIPRPVRVNVIQLADGNMPMADTPTQAITSLTELDLSGGKRFQITLAAVNSDEAIEIAAPTVSVQPSADLAMIMPETTKITDPAIADTAQDDAVVDEDATEHDIRLVSGNLVNMRSGPGTSFDQIGKLSKGTEVAVLQDAGTGWIELRVVETGNTGWMADWLITASN